MQRTGIERFGIARRGLLRSSFFALTLGGLGLATAACGSNTTGAAANPMTGAAAQVAAAPAAQQVAPGLAVSCGANQQAMVRQHVVNGQPTVAVECIAVAPTVAGPTAYAAPVAAPQYLQQPVTRVSDRYAEESWNEPAPVRRTSSTARSRPASYRTDGDVLTYEPRAERRKTGRSWQKSAVIIGSSAGIGAGVGAAVGGKKGALIGAAVGGGGAAIWDQATRRK